MLLETCIGLGVEDFYRRYFNETPSEKLSRIILGLKAARALQRILSHYSAEPPSGLRLGAGLQLHYYCTYTSANMRNKAASQEHSIVVGGKVILRSLDLPIYYYSIGSLCCVIKQKRPFLFTIVLHPAISAQLDKIIDNAIRNIGKTSQASSALFYGLPPAESMPRRVSNNFSATVRSLATTPIWPLANSFNRLVYSDCLERISLHGG